MLQLPRMVENSDKRSSLLGEKELQQLSTKWRNKSTRYSAKLWINSYKAWAAQQEKNFNSEEDLPLESYQA